MTAPVVGRDEEVAAIRAFLARMYEGPCALDPAILSRTPARARYRCNTLAMSTTQNRDGLGRFPKGISGNN